MHTWLMVALFAACLLLSGAAAVLAIYSCFASRAAMRRSGTASLRAELDEIRDGFEKHSALLKRISSRTFMQESRARAAGDSSASQAPNESPSEWKARMRKQLATGRIRHE